MGARIFNFVETRKQYLRDAYNWAINEQRRYGFLAQPIKIHFSHDNLDYDTTDCYASVFYDEAVNEALMRRDWPDQNIVQYNILVNYHEIERTAPKSLNMLKENGLNLYRQRII